MDTDSATPCVTSIQRTDKDLRKMESDEENEIDGDGGIVEKTLSIYTEINFVAHNTPESTDFN